MAPVASVSASRGWDPRGAGARRVPLFTWDASFSSQTPGLDRSYRRIYPHINTVCLEKGWKSRDFLAVPFVRRRERNTRTLARVKHLVGCLTSAAVQTLCAPIGNTQQRLDCLLCGLFSLVYSLLCLGELQKIAFYSLSQRFKILS